MCYAFEQRQSLPPAVILTVSDSAAQNVIKYLTFVQSVVLSLRPRAAGSPLQDIVRPRSK